jgi:nitronate monooxygenase
MIQPRLDAAVARLKQITHDIVTETGDTTILRRVREYGRALRNSNQIWPALRIGNLRASVPIVQGGMGVGISLSGLASAVADAGGIGVIAANGIGLLEQDYYKDGKAANLRAFRREIRAARARTQGIIGVNIMVAVNDFPDLLDVAIEERVDIVFMGAGLPIKNLPVTRMRDAGVKAVPIVSSVRATEMIFKMWEKIYSDIPDAVVFEGPQAGGHLGFTAEQIDDPEYQLEAITPEIVAALRPFEERFQREIPLIAGGGVFTGEDIHTVLELGAGGVQMGTRFVATKECDADDRFKEAYVDAGVNDIGLIQSPVGMPGRAIRNTFITDSEAGLRPAFKCAWQCLSSCKADKAKYCISIALNNARKGNLKQGFVFAGSNAARITEITTVSDLMGELAAGFRLAAGRSAADTLEALLGRIQRLRAVIASLVPEAGLTRRTYENYLKKRITESWTLVAGLGVPLP